MNSSITTTEKTDSQPNVANVGVTPAHIKVAAAIAVSVLLVMIGATP